MTKKDYVLLAKAIREANDEVAVSGVEPDVAVQTVVDSICDALAFDNDRFDRERFLKACGV